MIYRFVFPIGMLFFALFSLSTTANSQQIYKTDPGHTEVFFSWSHAGVSMQYGEFTRFEGTLTLYPDKLEDSHVEATVDATSVSAGFGPMDKMLKSKSLLDVENYPEITFKSTSVEVIGKEAANVTGDLTIHGVTRSVVLETKLTHRGSHPLSRNFPDYYSGSWLAFEAKGKIHHPSFDVGSSSTIGSKGSIFIEIRTEMQRK